MRKILLIICITLSSVLVHGQEHRVMTIDKSNNYYYQWITFLSEGEINWEGQYGGVAFRVAITTSEIYNDIYIEKVSMGEEGGNKNIEWKKLVDRDDLIDNFGLEGEFTGVEFVKWITWNSFVLNIHDKRLLFKEIEPNRILIEELE